MDSLVTLILNLLLDSYVSEKIINVNFPIIIIRLNLYYFSEQHSYLYNRGGGECVTFIVMRLGYVDEETMGKIVIEVIAVLIRVLKLGV